MKQLTLAIQLPRYANFATFVSKGNELVVGALKDMCSEPHAGGTVFLQGPQASGKSHLLQACCHSVNISQASVYLDLAQSDFTPDVLEGWEHTSLICLDNLDTVLVDPDWQEAVFDLFNRRLQRDNGSKASLLMASRKTLSELSIDLLDLRSRLSSGLVYSLNMLADDYLSEAIQRQAEQRGFELSDGTMEYLLRRLPRNLKTLIQTLDRFDQASLEAQRKLTVPFIKSILD